MKIFKTLWKNRSIFKEKNWVTLSNQQKIILGSTTVVAGGVGLYAGEVGLYHWHTMNCRRNNEKLNEEIIELEQWQQENELPEEGIQYEEILFHPYENLNLNREAPIEESQKHLQIRTKLQQRLDHLQKKQAQDSWLQKRQSNLQLLARKDQLIEETQLWVRVLYHLNEAAYGLKRRYPSAVTQAERVLQHLDELNKLNPSFPFPKRVNDLKALSLNLCAKSARQQKNYRLSDMSYEEALKIAVDPNLGVVLTSSQLALWGDLAWSEEVQDPVLHELGLKRLTSELGALDRRQYYVDLFRKYQKPFGLMNISWGLIRLYEEQDTSLRSMEFLTAAMQLAKEAKGVIPIQKSINPWLFHGIANLLLAEAVSANTQDEHLTEALQDFNEILKPQPYHVSALYRKTQILSKMGDYAGAYAAAQLALIEINYQLQQMPFSAPVRYSILFAKLLKEKARLESHLDKEIVMSRDKINALMTVKALNAYHEIYQDILTEPSYLQIQNWFAHRFDTKPTFAFKDGEVWKIKVGLKMPSLHHLILLSQYAYQEKRQKLIPPFGWVVLCHSEEWEEAEKEGYQGIACYRQLADKSYQLVISHAGTDPTSWPDLKTDLNLSNGKMPIQFKRAEEFSDFAYERFKQACHNKEKEGSLYNTVYHTGHSLGGALASYVASTRRAGEFGHQLAVTWDAPGVWWLLQHTYPDIKDYSFANYGRDFPVVNFLTLPSFINCAGGWHVGQRWQLPVIETTQNQPKPLVRLIREESISLLEEELTQFLQALKISIISPNLIPTLDELARIAAENLQRHALLKQVALFEENSFKQHLLFKRPEQAFYICEWPKDLKAWYEYQLAGQKGEQTNLVRYLPYVDPTTALPCLHLETVPSGLKEFLEVILEDKNIANPQLKHFYESAIQYIDLDILAQLKKHYDPKHKMVYVPGVLSTWELQEYLRLQLQEACQAENQSVMQILYPEIAGWRRNPSFSKKSVQETSVKRQETNSVVRKFK